MALTKGTKIMNINQKSNRYEAKELRSEKSIGIPDQPVRELQKRAFEINALYHQANDLRILVRQIADSTYGDEVESEETLDEPSAQIDLVGSMHGLTFEIGQLDQAMAELRGQVSRLQNL
jgi:hypothetical protein